MGLEVLRALKILADALVVGDVVNFSCSLLEYVFSMPPATVAGSLLCSLR